MVSFTKINKSNYNCIAKTPFFIVPKYFTLPLSRYSKQKIMTKIKTALACALVIGSAATAFAEGYQINTLSSKQLGMGHTGVALQLGAESMFFNPAGMAFSDKTIDISASLTGVKAIGTARVAGKGRFKTDNKMATPISAFAAFKVNDRLQLGLAFYTPYGSGINWGDNWPGATYSQKVSLKTFTLQPTASFKINDHLSVGAGLTMNWGNVDLTRGLVSGQTVDGLLGQPMFGDVTPASVNLKGTSSMGFGVNLGVMYKINDQWTVGANWRSKVNVKVKKGDAKVSYGTNNQTVISILDSKLGYIDETNFASSMPMPQVFAFGTSFRPNERWTFAADAQFTGWKTYKKLDIDFDLPTAELNAAFDQSIAKNYHNAWAFKFGTQFAATERLDLRLGLMVDNTPVDKHYYNPETPGMTKIEPTIGASFRPIKNLSIDFGFMYVQGVGRDNCSVTQINPLTRQPETFTADYRVRAFNPSIGLSYSF